MSRSVGDLRTRTPVAAAHAGLVFVVALAAYLALVAHFDFVTDDAFIDFRFAKHLAAGEGFSFNPGVDGPVEGTSQVAWVVMLAAFEKLGLDPTVWSRIVSVSTGVALLWRISRFLAVESSLSLAASAMGVGFVALMPPIAAWSTGGLSTMPFAFLLFVLFERLCGPRVDSNGWATGICALTLTLLRAESLPWVLGLVATAFVFARRDAEPLRAKSARRTLLVVAIGFAAFIAWRLRYFGYPLPNTAYAKVGGTREELERGVYYVARFFTIFPTAIAIVAAALWIAWRERSIVHVGALAVISVSAAFALAVGGDFMGMFRFAVPAIPFLGVLFASAIERTSNSGAFARRLATTLFALHTLVALSVSFGFEPLRAFLRRSASPESKPSQSQLQELRFQRDDAESWSDLGRALKRHCKPGDSLVARGIGAMGYYSDLTIFDRHGLVTTSVSHGGLARTRGAAGHDLFVGVKFFEPRAPTYAYAGLHPRSELERPNPALVARIFGMRGDEDLVRVYRPIVVPEPELGRGDLFLLLAEREPHPTGADLGWSNALLAPENLRADR